MNHALVLVSAAVLAIAAVGVHVTANGVRYQRIKDISTRTRRIRQVQAHSHSHSQSHEHEHEHEHEQSQSQSVERVSPATSLTRKEGAADFYKYPSHTNKWRDSTGCQYGAYEWGGPNVLGVKGTTAYAWGVCSIAHNAPVGPDKVATGHTFYHSSAASANTSSPHQVVAPLRWVATAMPTRPLWITVDIEQSVGIAAKEAEEIRHEITTQPQQRQYPHALAPVEVWVYSIRIVAGQTLNLLPLPPCKCAGRTLLNAYIEREWAERHRGDKTWKTTHNQPAKVLFRKPLLGVNMEMDTDEGTALKLLCALFATQPGTAYDGWRSPWDQDELMICPHAITKLQIPGMSFTVPNAGVVTGPYAHTNGLIRTCPAAVWRDRFAVVPTTEGTPKRTANAILVRGRKEEYANWYAKQTTPQMRKESALVLGNAQAGAAQLPGAAIMTGRIEKTDMVSPFPTRLDPALATHCIKAENSDAFRYAFYYRALAPRAAPGTANTAGAPFTLSDLTDVNIGCAPLV